MKGDALKETILTTDTPTKRRQELFMVGESPTKLDSEVLSAMNNMEIDPERNPCITKWRNTIMAYPSSQWQSWPRPTRRKSLTGTPNCSPSRLSFCSPGPHTPAQSCCTQTILCRTLFCSPNWHRETTRKQDVTSQDLKVVLHIQKGKLANILHHHSRSIV